MSSLSLTHTILLKTCLSPSGSRFVLMFVLHDSSPKGFLDTAIISLRSRHDTPRCMFRTRDQSALPCRDTYFSLQLISCRDHLVHHHSPLNLRPILLTPRKNFPPHHHSPVSVTPRTLDLVVTIPVIHHSCLLPSTLPCFRRHRQIRFCPFWHLLLLWFVPVLFYERSIVRTHLYFFIVVHTHALVAIIFFLVPRIVFFSHLPRTLAPQADTRVLPCSAVRSSLQVLGREVSDFHGVWRVLCSSDRTDPASALQLL